MEQVIQNVHAVLLAIEVLMEKMAVNLVDTTSGQVEILTTNVEFVELAV